MLNETTRVLAFLCIALFIATGCSKPDTVPAIVELEKKYPEIQKKYVYQSLIRLANVRQDPNFEKLIKDLKKITLYLPPREDSTYNISGMRAGIRKDGYEELIDVRTADAQRISLWVKESGKKSHYLGMVDSETEDIILELDGEIHPEYLGSIKLADESSLLNLLKGGF